MAVDGRSGRKSVTVNLKNPALNEMFRVVLDYEAMLRGTTRGRVFAEMVLDCIDGESYPERVMAELGELEARRRAEAEARIGERLGTGAAR